MGGVWCRADRGRSTTYDSKGTLSSAISRWTDHVRQAYKKPKAQHRPPRPPQKPLRCNNRLVISPPQLVTEQSSDGWRTATLIVPQPVPIPPPRKKRLRFQELARTSYSMDDLNSSFDDLRKSTFSLQERYSTESGLESSSTIVVTPVLESRVDHTQEVLTEKVEKTSNQDELLDSTKNTDVEEEGVDEVDLGDEIVPVEKENMFTYRTLVHSNLGYVDKLSAISEVSAESGFDDRTDPGKFSERSESVTSDDSLTREMGFNILTHIHNMSKENETIDVREKTAKSKKEWLQNILKEEPDPYIISMEKEKKDSECALLDKIFVDSPGQQVEITRDSLHLNTKTESSNANDKDSKTLTSIPESPTNHSVLLGLLQENRDSAPKVPSTHYDLQGESIFLTNTKTNIIYKSLSSDNLTDDYENEYHSIENEESKATKSDKSHSDKDLAKLTLKSKSASEKTDVFNELNSNNQINSIIIQTPNLANLASQTNFLPDNKQNSVVAAPGVKDIPKCQDYLIASSDLHASDETINGTKIVVNVINSEPTQLDNSVAAENDNNLRVKEIGKKGSASSSRRSSLTDSLHEFEISIYDMLKESNRYQESSEEEESIKTVKSVLRH